MVTFQKAGNVFRKAKKVTFQKVTYFIRQKAKLFLFCMLIVDMMYDMKVVVVAWMLKGLLLLLHIVFIWSQFR